MRVKAPRLGPGCQHGHHPAQNPAREAAPVVHHQSDLDLPAAGEPSEAVAARVAEARARQGARYEGHAGVRVNADAEGELLKEVASPDAEGRALLHKAAEFYRLSARSYARILRVARTIADLAGAEAVSSDHVAEAISYRLS